MKTFKQFIFESAKAKEEFIYNSHGSHAFIDNNPYCSNVKENYSPNIEDNFLHNGTDQEVAQHDKKLNSDMENLHKEHQYSKEGVDAMYNLSKQGSKKFTEALLKNHVDKTPLNKEHSELTKKLDRHAFSPAKGKLDTYSGVNFDIKNVKSVGKSKDGNPVYHQPTYMSSSTDKSIAHFFAKKHEKKRAPGFFGALKEPIKDHSPKHIFHWHHEKDQPIGVVGKHSFYPAEKEVLIPRTESTPEKYHIEHLGTDKYTSHNGVEYNVHHVRRIPESEIIKNA